MLSGALYRWWQPAGTLPPATWRQPATRFGPLAAANLPTCRGPGGPF